MTDSILMCQKKICVYCYNSVQSLEIIRFDNPSVFTAYFSSRGITWHMTTPCDRPWMDSDIERKENIRRQKFKKEEEEAKTKAALKHPLQHPADIVDKMAILGFPPYKTFRFSLERCVDILRENGVLPQPSSTPESDPSTIRDTHSRVSSSIEHKKDPITSQHVDDPLGDAIANRIEQTWTDYNEVGRRINRTIDLKRRVKSPSEMSAITKDIELWRKQLLGIRHALVSNIEMYNKYIDEQFVYQRQLLHHSIMGPAQQDLYRSIDAKRYRNQLRFQSYIREISILTDIYPTYKQ